MQPEALVAAAFLALCIALGGGGSPAPFPELILELIAAGLALAALVRPRSVFDWQRVPRTAWTIALLVAVVPLMQLVPLPPLLWQALPARDLQQGALDLVGAAGTWRPWSLAPSRTLAALLSLGPPLLLLVMTAALGRRGRQWLIRTIVAMTLATLVVGTLQLTAGDDSPVHFYGVTGLGLVGFQANHNSTADVLLIGLMAVPLLITELVERRIVPNRAGPVLAIAGSAMAVVALGIVMTASRMGIMLMPVALLASMWFLRLWLAPTVRRLAYASAAIAALVLLALLLLRDSGAVTAVMARFDFSEELRPQLWVDSYYVAVKYFPFGVGMGDFVPAFIADERLESIFPSLPNRAHNDFLELACEAGVFGLAALSAISWLLVRALRQRLRAESGQGAATAMFAATVLAILALHSLVDYPFRSMALAGLGAVCAGLLLSPRLDSETVSNSRGAGKTR